MQSLLQIIHESPILPLSKATINNKFLTTLVSNLISEDGQFRKQLFSALYCPKLRTWKERSGIDSNFIYKGIAQNSMGKNVC
jgi:hypothetical protein